MNIKCLISIYLFSDILCVIIIIIIICFWQNSMTNKTVQIETVRARSWCFWALSLESNCGPFVGLHKIYLQYCHQGGGNRMTFSSAD